MFDQRENILKIFREKEKVIKLNFPIGFSKDGSLAHAYERILTYLGTSKGELLKYSFQENKESTGLKSFHNIHQGQDIYVLASGPSLERIYKNFFNNKITIGLGLVYKTINITYAVHKEYTTIDNEIYMLKNCKNIFSSLYKSGNRKRGFIMSNKESFRSTKIVYFDHYENELDKFKLDPLRKNSEKLFVSWSTITSAINLAAMMGAKI